MTDNVTSTAQTETVLSVIATTGKNVRNLPIANGQLVFVHDRNRLAFDFKGKRTFYNTLEVLDTEIDRNNIDYPIDGYYFCVDSAVLYHYADSTWTPCTKNTESTIFIVDEYPTLGQASGRLYINKTEREIAIWEDENNGYLTVSNYTEDATDEDIYNLFIGDNT